MTATSGFVRGWGGVTLSPKSVPRLAGRPDTSDALLPSSYPSFVGESMIPVFRLSPRCLQRNGTDFISLQSTRKRSALGTIREAELYGGVLSSSLSREHLALTAEFLRGDECVIVSQ